MSIMERTGSNDARNSVLECIADDRRRRILAALVDRSSPLGVAELADRVAGEEAPDAPETDAAAVQAALVHGSLPALASAGLVAWDRDAGTVRATDHPALADPAVRRLLERAGNEWDAVVDGVANECRSTVLTVLEGRTGPTPRETLAREVAGHLGQGEPSRRDVKETLVALHHAHLPKLDAVGLVEYDRDAETVTYRGHPELEAEWFADLAGGPTGTGRCSAD